jgi:hypothetical protein
MMRRMDTRLRGYDREKILTIANAVVVHKS